MSDYEEVAAVIATALYPLFGGRSDHERFDRLQDARSILDALHDAGYEVRQQGDGSVP